MRVASCGRRLKRSNSIRDQIPPGIAPTSDLPISVDLDWPLPSRSTAIYVGGDKPPERNLDMKRSACLLLMALLLAVGSGSWYARAANDATLVSAEAVFETTTNDKDHDSVVSIAVKVGNTVIAASSNTQGHWNDHSTHAITLDIGSGWKRNDLSARTKTELSFSTNGNDKWEFNYVLRLRWSDGTTTENRYNGQVLTQDDGFRSYVVSI
jgi:hypothetical protein